MVQEVHDTIVRGLGNNKLDEVSEVQRNVGKLVVTRLLRSVEELEGKKVLAVIDCVTLQFRIGQGFDDPVVSRRVDGG
jgi:hypothetical protein